MESVAVQPSVRLVDKPSPRSSLYLRAKNSVRDYLYGNDEVKIKTPKIGKLMFGSKPNKHGGTKKKFHRQRRK
jgi:hypothetical protein